MLTAHGQAAMLRPRPCLPSASSSPLPGTPLLARPLLAAAGGSRHRFQQQQQQQRRHVQVQAAAEPKEKQQERGAGVVPKTVPAPGGTPQPGGPPPPPPEEERDWPSIKKRPFVLKIADKVTDAVEDIGRHAYRGALPLPTRNALMQMVSGRRGETMQLKTDKPVVMVLGSGWGAHSIIKVIDTDKYEVVLVSPRNFFYFTPMLPSAAVGTVEFRSLTDPIRVANPFVTYARATCDRVDLQRKVATCTSEGALDGSMRAQFEVQYDKLVVAVGEQPATFGVKGVRENCFFMKEITDALELRKRVGENFEYAGLPSTTPEERARALHFVVVGGGPTGVEFSGTLADFVKADLRRKYPELMPSVRVTLLQSAASILTSFEGDLQVRALQQLKDEGVDVRLGVRVVEVTDKKVVLGNGDVLEHGACIWSAGNSTRQLTRDLIDALPEQRAFGNQGRGPTMQKLQVDPFLRVIGATDVIALGDCASVVGDNLPATAQVAAQQGSFVAHLINRGYDLGTGGLDLPPPSKELGRVEGTLAGATTAVAGAAGAAGSDQEHHQQPKRKYYPRTFDFLDLGAMAYVGGDAAATELKIDGNSTALFGVTAYLLWASVYMVKQVSLRNRVLILFDWIKSKAFGRDLSLF